MKKGMIIVASLFLLFSLSTVRAEVEVPESIKAIVPLLPGANILMALNTADGDQLHLEASTALPAVASFYKSHFKAEGWKKEMELSVIDGTTISFSRNGQTVMIIISGTEGEKTNVVISLSNK